MGKYLLMVNKNDKGVIKHEIKEFKSPYTRKAYKLARGLKDKNVWFNEGTEKI